jgi:hypothetical protein
MRSLFRKSNSYYAFNKTSFLTSGRYLAGVQTEDTGDAELRHELRPLACAKTVFDYSIKQVIQSKEIALCIHSGQSVLPTH